VWRLQQQMGSNISKVSAASFDSYVTALPMLTVVIVAGYTREASCRNTGASLYAV
jgi:hypothetical protein